ncbi:MAG: hypothetical protein ABIJ12_06250 [bacterium]
MKNSYGSILRIAAILLLSILFVAISAHADFDNEKYMKVHIRNVVDNTGITAFDNHNIIIYQVDDEIVTDNFTDTVVTVCFQNSGSVLSCYEINPGGRTQNYIPATCNQYTVSVLGVQRDIILLTKHTPAPSLSTYGVILLLLLLVGSTVFVMRKRASGAVNL